MHNLDLVVRNPHNPMISAHNLGEVRDAFSESNLPILVDILDWARIPDSFREEIERVGVVVLPVRWEGRCERNFLWHSICYSGHPSI